MPDGPIPRFRVWRHGASQRQRCRSVPPSHPPVRARPGGATQDRAATGRSLRRPMSARGWCPERCLTRAALHVLRVVTRAHRTRCRPLRRLPRAKLPARRHAGRHGPPPPGEDPQDAKSPSRNRIGIWVASKRAFLSGNDAGRKQVQRPRGRSPADCRAVSPRWRDNCRSARAAASPKNRRTRPWSPSKTRRPPSRPRDARSPSALHRRTEGVPRRRSSAR